MAGRDKLRENGQAVCHHANERTLLAWQRTVLRRSGLGHAAGARLHGVSMAKWKSPLVAIRKSPPLGIWQVCDPAFGRTLPRRGRGETPDMEIL